MATEDNAQVIPDPPIAEEPKGEIQPESQEEKETPETEEVVEEPTEASETEKSESQKEIETLQAQKEHWRKKAREGEAKLAKRKEDGEESADEEFKPRVEFLLENRSLNAEEYDHLAAVALRDSGKVDLESLRDAKKKETEYISFLRKKAENKRKSPGSTSASAISKLQKTPEEIAKMTPEEHRKYEEQIMEAQNQGI
jgi:hypothetical protein|tara:strand:- start:9603 stop:10196 length:594 start_codon:yes stop_codon:yes gene_type:complete